MTRFSDLHLASVIALTSALSLCACSSIENFAAGDRVDYRTAPAKVVPLDVPPDLTQLARDSRYQPQAGAVSAAAFQAGGTAPRSAAATALVAPRALGNVRIEREGNQRWLRTPLSPEQLWPQLQAFWKENGMTLIVDQPVIGVMETEWAENRAKLPDDFLRRTLGRIIESLYSTGERDKYLMRVERSAAGSDVFIAHRGLLETVRTDGARQLDSTVWVRRPNDPELEATLLTRLMVKLGLTDEQAKAVLVPPVVAAPARARVVEGEPAATLQVDDNFERAWRRVGLALDRSWLHRRRPRPRARLVLRSLHRSGVRRPGRARIFCQAVRRRQRRQRAEEIPHLRQGRRFGKQGLGIERARNSRERRHGQAHHLAPDRRPQVTRSAFRSAALHVRFCSLGSGSSGNATLVEARSSTTTTRVLIDCGFSLRELDLRLARAGLELQQIDAVFVTHEHGDHVGCALGLAQRHGIPLWMSRGTWRAIGEPALPDAPAGPNFARDGDVVCIGDIELRPFTVPHDAQEPLQLRCSDGRSRLGVLTDVGSVTPHLLSALHDCDALLLECNHDAALLAGSSYPASLKARIGGRLGHLANDVAAKILGELRVRNLQHLVAAHLSERNNRPALARLALAEACGAVAADIVVADPTLGFDWLSIA